MGAIRSFDGRNCEWLIKYPRAVGTSHGSPIRGHTVASVYQIHPRGVWFAWSAFRGNTVASVY